MLFVVLIALGIAVIAFNRSGGNVSDVVIDRTEKISSIRLYIRLAALQARENAQDIFREIAEIRQNFAFYL